jgi:hypothetical protein
MGLQDTAEAGAVAVMAVVPMAAVEAGMVATAYGYGGGRYGGIGRGYGGGYGGRGGHR